MGWDIGAFQFGSDLTSPPEFDTSPPSDFPETSPPDSIVSQPFSAGRTPLFLLDILLDFGNEHVSDRQVNSPSSANYEPFVVSWGVFENSIPSPAGLPIVGDAKFKLAESQARKWRDLFSHQTPRRRKVVLWALFEGESLAFRQTSPLEPRTPFFTGEIVDAIFNADRSIDITCRDTVFAWIDEPIPAMITKDIYPGLLDRFEGQFLPIVTGMVRTDEELSSPDQRNKRGQIALPQMGWNDETGDRWGIAAHPCTRVVVYRKVELTVSSNSALTSSFGDGTQIEEWELVDPGEYTETLIPITAFGIQMYHHVIDFFVLQADGTELRADIDGPDFRGNWEGLAEVGTPVGSPLVPPTGGTALRNAIDFFINMTYFVMSKAGVSIDVFDTDDIIALREKFESLGIKCDGAITKPITCREWLAQFLISFNLDMWQKRNGKISLNYTDEENIDRTIYTETDLILENTFSERLPEKPYNQYQFRYKYNYADDAWGTWGLLDTLDQSVLAIIDVPKIEKEVVDLQFVRDDATAITVTTHRSEFQALGSYSQEWKLPLPEVRVDLELSSLIGVTHRMGLETGGYVNREVKVLKMRHDLDNLVTTVSGVLRVPQIVAVVSPA